MGLSFTCKIMTGKINWSRYGRPTGCNFNKGLLPLNSQTYIELNFKYGTTRNYKINLTSILQMGRAKYGISFAAYKKTFAANLYQVWRLFLTPVKRCTVVMYECQTQSRKYRPLNKTLGAYFSELDDL